MKILLTAVAKKFQGIAPPRADAPIARTVASLRRVLETPRSAFPAAQRGALLAAVPRSARSISRQRTLRLARLNLGRLDEAVTSARALVAAHPRDPLANEVARHPLPHPLTHPIEVGRQ